MNVKASNQNVSLGRRAIHTMDVDMKRLYARLVLWMIGPVLEERVEHSSTRIPSTVISATAMNELQLDLMRSIDAYHPPLSTSLP